MVGVTVLYLYLLSKIQQDTHVPSSVYMFSFVMIHPPNVSNPFLQTNETLKYQNHLFQSVTLFKIQHIRGGLGAIS